MESIELEKKRSSKIQELLNQIPKVGDRLKSHIESDRFPYTYAYDFERSGSRSDTGTKLREKFKEDIKGYAREIISRAFSYIVKEYSFDLLWDIIDEEPGDNIKETYLYIMNNFSIYN
ncbi:MAG: hypothetical protein LLF98_02525 [Clostridium sp.]|uniref:hypothetical protein n=1 Tax=Clostridium sp. TaxID=1506 RepID=UPI0025C0748D|nr:hypothetical protein [Clostridium sp.]MCE5220158.1 hypothetical protein [Clostridium sp.]